jgi:hypothetical protein
MSAGVPANSDCVTVTTEDGKSPFHGLLVLGVWELGDIGFQVVRSSGAMSTQGGAGGEFCSKAARTVGPI